MSNLAYEIEFNEEVRPYSIHVHEDFLQQTKQKLALTRFVEDELEQPEFTDGPPTHAARDLAQYWQNEYDWRVVERHINSQLKQFTTIVQPS
jgi:hypothetical protein